MNTRKLLLLLICFVSVAMAKAQIPARKIDTSMKVGKAGYRLSCNNKNPDRNTVTITPVGFDKDTREFSFEIKGRVTKAEVDDINRDGFPDLVFYVFTIGLDSLPKGNVIGISSEANQSVAPISFPDIYDDPKLRVGYKGNDEFFLMEGYLVRRFPIAVAAGATTPAQGVLYRQIQYMVVPGERGGAKFKPMRSYEFAKQ